MAEYSIAGTLINTTYSLRQYITAQRRFRDGCNETLAAIDEGARFYDTPLKLVSKVHAYTDVFMDKIICELMQEFSVYDCVKEDFVGDGDYPQFDVIRQDFEKYAAHVKATGDASISVQLERAAQEASSQITGVGFGLISNSLISHLVYAVQNEEAIKKQTKSAQRYYDQKQRQIQTYEEGKIEQTCRRYYDKITVPKLKVEIHKLYTDALVVYIKILSQAGCIDIEEIQGFNFERSQQILRNINMASNAQNVVAAALKECPYNTDIYVQAIKKGILKRELTQLAKDLGLEPELNSLLGGTSDAEAEAYIDSQLERFLCNQIDRFDDNWEIRAKAYLRESRAIVQQYPDSFAGYGLVASYLIASNWNNRTGEFWPEVNKNIEKFLSNYTEEEGYSYHFDDLLRQLSDYLCEYFELAEEYLDENWHSDNEYLLWQRVALVKRAQIPAIHTYLWFINCIEKRFANGSTWQADSEKNTFLWYLYIFCKPHLTHRYATGTKTIVDCFYHLPLSERTFAIKLYDELIAEGVDKNKYGLYSIKKEGDSRKGLKEMEEIYGVGLWRREISAEGMKYLSPSYSPLQTTGGCYVATAVYGSYDCPQVWTLRRYRDHILARTWYGRSFIRSYYAISPRLVKVFGHTTWFRNMWRKKLDHMVEKLNASGIDDAPYEDMTW